MYIELFEHMTLPENLIGMRFECSSHACTSVKESEMKFIALVYSLARKVSNVKLSNLIYVFLITGSWTPASSMLGHQEDK